MAKKLEQKSTGNPIIDAMQMSRPDLPITNPKALAERLKRDYPKGFPGGALPPELMGLQRAARSVLLKNPKELDAWKTARGMRQEVGDESDALAYLWGAAVEAAEEEERYRAEHQPARTPILERLLGNAQSIQSALPPELRVAYSAARNGASYDNVNRVSKAHRGRIEETTPKYPHNTNKKRRLK